MSRETGGESAMSTVISCHNYNKIGHKLRDCKILTRKLKIEKSTK